jgi:hypothetical protein
VKFSLFGLHRVQMLQELFNLWGQCLIHVESAEGESDPLAPFSFRFLGDRRNSHFTKPGSSGIS